MKIKEAKQALDKIIDKSRVHLYKPIQIAEILYRYRTVADFDVSDLATYRNESKRWRDIVCVDFLGRTSTSSARFQDDLFNANAVPPEAIVALATENNQKNGIVESYIYAKFAERFTQMSTGLDYCHTHNEKNFKLDEFINLFWKEAGLKRSIDKIYEIVVYALFSAIVDALGVTIEVKMDESKKDILSDFSDFAEKILSLNMDTPTRVFSARLNRVGVTNAADRGLDMWANFGLAIQIKHLSLTEELAENIVGSVTSDRIVIVCKDSEQKLIISLLTQLGWKSKIQSIVTESDLIRWYNKALRGTHANKVAMSVLTNLHNEIQVEFPVTDVKRFAKFCKDRNYTGLSDPNWKVTR